MPGGVQVPPEPVDLSSGNHPHWEQQGLKSPLREK